MVASVILQGLGTLRRSASLVSLIHPNGWSDRCSAYWQLAKGRNILVTMPKGNPNTSFSSHSTLWKVNELTKGFSQHDIKTFVLVPNKRTEMQEQLCQIKARQFSVFCDPENVIAGPLGLTVPYQDLKHPKNAPDHLHILMIDGTVAYVGNTVEDHEFRGLVKKVSEIFSKKTNYNRL